GGLLGGGAWAAGVVPQTPVVLVSEADGEGSINLTNTDGDAVLLFSSIENVPEDLEELLFVTSPVVRVEAGEKQLVRFVFQSERPLTSQRYKRAIFEGIPQQRDGGGAVVGISVRQNLPVIISPKDLPANDEPWRLLKWEVKGRILSVRNDSRYVVRLTQQLELIPAGRQLSLPRTYILPGQSEVLELPEGVVLAAGSSVRLYPVSLYGYSRPAYDAPLSK
ncbi:fimbria/pilus chaperone family protein, partial [Pseudomonas sp. NCIMB 10586]|uniref:fimbria/pilus chaperone family protein n=1 Tax=Pseudomonas sp. NCIMB 10586 TaxID=2558872 RepID=UPI0032B7EA8B